MDEMEGRPGEGRGSGQIIGHIMIIVISSS
jgi:hypothetical protein